MNIPEFEAKVMPLVDKYESEGRAREGLALITGVLISGVADSELRAALIRSLALSEVDLKMEEAAKDREIGQLLHKSIGLTKEEKQELQAQLKQYLQELQEGAGDATTH